MKINEQEMAILTAALQEALLVAHGPLIGGESVWKVLGFPSVDAFRQAMHRHTLPDVLMNIEQRVSQFALIYDVAEWLATERLTNAVKRSPVNLETLESIPKEFRKLFYLENGIVLTPEQYAPWCSNNVERFLKDIKAGKMPYMPFPTFRIEHRPLNRLFALAVEVLPFAYQQSS